MFEASTIQRLALATQQTVGPTLDASDIHFLAGLGTYGKDDQNASRELINKFCKGNDNPAPEPYVVVLPVQVRNAAECEKRVEFKDFHLLLPHQWFALHAPDHIWQTIFGVHDVPVFWEEHELDKDPKL